MTSWEKEELVMALNVRLCLIETGHTVLRATDVHNQMRGASSDQRDRLSRMLKPLSSETMKHILKLEALRDKIFNAKVIDA